MQFNEDNLIWIDLEMTGLDPQTDRIIEIATIVTDPDLNILAEGPVIAIHQEESLLDAMDEWNTSHHTASGLVERVRSSTFTEEQAANDTIEFLKAWISAGKSPMCGNSICQDRRFMVRLMPELEEYFHYRNMDVSSIKEMVRRWAPEKLKGFSKQGKHLALDDIKDSIGELVFYRQEVFKI